MKPSIMTSITAPLPLTRSAQHRFRRRFYAVAAGWARRTARESTWACVLHFQSSVVAVGDSRCTIVNSFVKQRFSARESIGGTQYPPNLTFSVYGEAVRSCIAQKDLSMSTGGGRLICPWPKRSEVFTAGQHAKCTYHFSFSSYGCCAVILAQLCRCVGPIIH